jgi:hypothetical protein
MGMEGNTLTNKPALQSSRDSYTYQHSKYQLRGVQEHVITDTLWAKTLVLFGFPEHHNGQ